jgi:hypothetical protein
MLSSRFLQFLVWLAGIVFFVWAFYDPRFRDAEGFLEGGFCLPFSFGVALVMLGWGIAGRFRKFSFWFALALVGQSVALQMIEAFPYVRYQHYKPFYRLLTETHPILLIYIGLQTALVTAGFRTRWTKVRAWLGHNLKAWQLLCVGLVFFLSSATLSREIPIYVAELFFATFIQAINLGNAILMVWALPEEVLAFWRQKLDKLFGQPEREGVRKSAKVDRFALSAAIWIIMVATLLCLFSYERHPHIPDEVSYLFQARYFAKGMLVMLPPPVLDAFEVNLMTYKANMWYSPFPPGWPAVLALGVLSGVPWLVNPLLAGLNMLLAYVLFREIYDRRTARIALLLLCFSPWYVFMAMNFMSHTFALTCFLGAALAVARARRTKKAIWGWAGGFLIGMLSLIRPLEGVIVAGLLGLWAIGVGGMRLKSSAIAGLVLGAIVVGSVVLPYNMILTGDAATFPVMEYFDKYYGPGANALGFGPNRGLGWAIDPFPGHSFIDAIINANLNIFLINIELFGWSTGSLILIAILLFSGATRRNDYLMLVVISAVIGIHIFYWFSGGPDFGARYWYVTIVPCVVLTARGIQYLSIRLEANTDVTSYNGERVIVGVLLLCLLTLVNYFPWRAVDKYHHYRGMRPDIRYLAKEYGFGKSLVLIKGNNIPDYASAATYNPVDLQADSPVYAWDQNAQVRTKLLKSFSDRPVWIVNGPSITHSGFKVVEGPISTLELKTNEKRTSRYESVKARE